jgi:flagellar protein FliL
MVEDDDNEATPTAPPRSGPGMLQMAFMGIGIFVLVVAAQVAVPGINRWLYGDPNAAPAAAVTDEEQQTEELADEPEAQAEGEVDFSKLDPPIYTPLDPPLVVSLASSDGSSHFLQMSVQAMARDQHAIDAIKTHAPALRNSFLFLVATHTVDDLASLQGKENLRSEMREEARAVLQRNTGKPALEELYFTSFVIQ